MEGSAQQGRCPDLRLRPGRAPAAGHAPALARRGIGELDFPLGKSRPMDNISIMRLLPQQSPGDQCAQHTQRKPGPCPGTKPRLDPEEHICRQRGGHRAMVRGRAWTMSVSSLGGRAAPGPSCC